jgi:hypothetical protein
MDSQTAGACLCKGFDVALGLFDHQMDIQREFRNASAGLDDKRSHGDVGREMPIHHIDMDPVPAGSFDGGNLFAEPCKIRGENGSGNNISVH